MWLLLLFTQMALSFDPLALISDDTKRNTIEKAQQDEINRRTGLASSDCSELLSDLPFEGTSKTPFVTAFGTIQNMMGGIRYWDQHCLNQLVQNLATLNSPVALRIAGEILKTDYEKSVTRNATYCAPPTNGLEQILGLAKNIDRIRNCTPLAEGKWKTIGGISKSGIDYSYGLIKEAPQKIKAILNVQFSGANNGVTAQAMHARAQTCLNSIKSGLKGPAGEELSISLLTPQEVNRLPANLRPKKTTITIAGVNARSHSKAYASSIDCPTILHEVLHLLGLCDEYPGEGDNYPCRAVGSRESVMRNQNLTFGTALSENLSCHCDSEECSNVMADPAKRALLLMPTYYDIIPGHFRNRYCEFNPTIYLKSFSDNSMPSRAYSASLESEDVLTVIANYNPMTTHFDEAHIICRCPATDIDCKTSLKEYARPNPNLKPKTCPSPTNLKSSIIGAAPVADRFENGVLHIYRPATKPSLLEPRHFNRIIAGNCQTQTASYERCAEFAYESSKVACEKAPNECLNNTAWGQ